MKFDVPNMPPTVMSDDVLDIGKERELRTLRTRVAELEKKVDQYRKHVVPGAREPDFDEEKHRATACGFHPQVTVSMTTPRVECSVCKEELDALDVLRAIAKEEIRFCYQLNYLREEKVLLDKEVNELKKQRNSLRSQIKRKTKES